LHPKTAAAVSRARHCRAQKTAANDGKNDSKKNVLIVCLTDKKERSIEVFYI
jgi:hypothetical protein